MLAIISLLNMPPHLPAFEISLSMVGYQYARYAASYFRYFADRMEDAKKSLLYLHRCLSLFSTSDYYLVIFELMPVH